MRAPCEEIVSSFLPFIRSYVTVKLVNDYNYSQKQVAEALDISQPAVSFYLNKKRGSNLAENEVNRLLSNDLKQILDKMIEDIRQGKDKKKIHSAICKACKTKCSAPVV
ncbi:MAG: transcriptional regulator [Candidatus Ranarchaeia archaeon]